MNNTYWTASGLPTLPEELKGAYALCKTVNAEWKTISDKIAAKYTSDPVLYKETAYEDFTMWTPAWATSSDKIEGSGSTTIDFSNINFDMKKAVWYFCSGSDESLQKNLGNFVIAELLNMAEYNTGKVIYGTTDGNITTNNSAITGDTASYINGQYDTPDGLQIHQFNSARATAQEVYDKYSTANTSGLLHA